MTTHLKKGLRAIDKNCLSRVMDNSGLSITGVLGVAAKNNFV